MTAAQQVLQQSLIENWIVQLGGTIKQEKSKMIFYDGQRRLRKRRPFYEFSPASQIA